MIRTMGKKDYFISYVLYGLDEECVGNGKVREEDVTVIKAGYNENFSSKDGKKR